MAAKKEFRVRKIGVSLKSSTVYGLGAIGAVAECTEGGRGGGSEEGGRSREHRSPFYY